MDSVRMALLASLLCAGGALAQVPDSGRWQDLAFAADEVDSRMEDSYIARVVGLAAAGKLDEDRALLTRVRAIGAALIRAAVDMKPEAAEWQWEFHVTSDPEVEAFCMAGGKILVGAAFVHQLALDDGELATLLAHEVAHAIAEHHREILSAALFLNRPAVPIDVLLERMDTDLGMQIRLAGLASLQESEADQLGMVLAHRAGWPSAAMLSFYRKLAGIDSGSGLASSHPAPGSRVSMAKGMALMFGR